MTRSSIRLLGASTLALALAGGLAVTTPLLAQSEGPAAERERTEKRAVLRGEVTDIFGESFILDTGAERVLIELAPGGSREGVREGGRIEVSGRRDGGVLTGARIAGPRAQAQAQARAHRSAHDAGGAMVDAAEARRIVDGTGLGRVTEMERKRHHYAFDLIDAQGREVEVDVGLDGQITKIEFEGYAFGTFEDVAALIDPGMRDMLETLGMASFEEVATKRDHVKVEGRDAAGREIEVKFGFDGTPVKLEIEGGGAGTHEAFATILPAEVADAVAAAGFAAIEEVEAKWGAFDVEGRDARGAKLEMVVGTDGRVHRAPRGDRRRSERGGERFGERDLGRRLEAAGYAMIGAPERKKRHYEVFATNPHGERVELRIDRDGQIRRERFER